MTHAATRLGRPPASSSVETKARILDVARRKFAAHGFDATSNRALAEEAGLTTGAIYHYFDSKLGIYVAVYQEAQERVYDRFAAAIEGHTTFKDQFVATLEAAHELNTEDPTLALFLGSCRIDAGRDVELASALRGAAESRHRRFFEDMVALGVTTHEFGPHHVPLVNALVRTVTVGLTDAVSHDRATHRAAVDAVIALLEGTLLEGTPLSEAGAPATPVAPAAG